MGSEAACPDPKGCFAAARANAYLMKPMPISFFDNWVCNISNNIVSMCNKGETCVIFTIKYFTLVCMCMFSPNFNIEYSKMLRKVVSVENALL